MTQVMIRHRVQDYTAWKAEFDSFADFRRSSGEKSYRIMRPGDDANDLILFFEWDNRANAETFLSSSELKTAMQRAGVAEEPNIVFLNEVAQGAL